MENWNYAWIYLQFSCKTFLVLFCDVHVVFCKSDVLIDL